MKYSFPAFPKSIALRKNFGVEITTQRELHSSYFASVLRFADISFLRSFFKFVATHLSFSTCRNRYSKDQKILNHKYLKMSTTQPAYFTIPKFGAQLTWIPPAAMFEIILFFVVFFCR